MSDRDDAPVFEGDDLDEALGAASAELGVPAERIAYDVLEEGRRGVFGLGARRVRIRVRGSEDDATALAIPEGTEESGLGPQVEGPVAKAPADAPEPPPGLVETVSRMLTLMGFRASVRAARHPDGWTLHVAGADRKLLVKRDGEVLRAIEFLLNRMARRAWPGGGSLHVESEGFRSKRDEDLVELAREVAGVVARSGRAELLHEMNPYERRLVHLAIQEFEGVRSVSEGDGFFKRVRVERARG